ncbi:MAG: SWIM zinc finger family protein, partial [Bryobacteraceae bacterium]
EWSRVEKEMAHQALFMAKLLAGEMPREIEEAFTACRLALFPASKKDMKTDCSCPDWSNPCKHVAAVYYLLGEEFDRDPFLIFQLRGMGREDFLRTLGDSMPLADDAAEEPIPDEPLPSSPASFWKAAATPEHLAGVIDRQHSGAALPRRLGKFPFWRGRENFLESLESIYTSAASRTARKMSAEEDHAEDATMRERPAFHDRVSAARWPPMRSSRSDAGADRPRR